MGIRSVIDHVLLRGADISACAALAAPSEDAVTEAGGLPNERHPSDHIPVVVDINFRGMPPPPSADPGELLRPAESPQSCISEKDLLCLGQGLPQSGRVALTEDGFKYVLLPKEWQAARGQFVDAAAAFYRSVAKDQLDAD